MKLLWLLVLMALTGCTTPPVLRSDVAADSGPQYYRPPAAEPLFASDKQVMSDEQIARALDYRVQLPARARIVVLNLSGARVSWSPDAAQASATQREGLLAKLRGSARVARASYLPVLLVPKDRTVGHLREAAARYQADLLLAYQASCDRYQRYKLVAADEVKAYCFVEGVLLDVRSGIVPFTYAAQEDYFAKENKSDMEFAETARKAEMAAIATAMDRIAAEFVNFLATTPARK